MLTTPTAQPSERKLSSVDLFCMQTYQPAQRDPLRRARGIALTLGLMCLILLGSLGYTVWRGSALERERDGLARELSDQRANQVRATLAARDLEMDVANYALETRVRRDIVDQQMLQQQRRELELEQRALEVERAQLARADCLTPRSILVASNL
jgi:hypothetical protein